MLFNIGQDTQDRANIAPILLATWVHVHVLKIITNLKLMIVSVKIQKNIKDTNLHYIKYIKIRNTNINE